MLPPLTSLGGVEIPPTRGTKLKREGIPGRRRGGGTRVEIPPTRGTKLKLTKIFLFC